MDNWLAHRNQNLGSMFSSELAWDYLCILFALLEFRRDHEFEVLREDLFRTVHDAHDVSCTGEAWELPRFDAEIGQLESWGIVGRRMEKTRLRSYKDVRRDVYRYSLKDETVAFLLWLEERHANDLLPHDDDSINLLEFVLSSCKQLNRNLREADERFANVVFALGDVQEKTGRLSRNLNGIAARLGDFLQKTYSADEARETVHGLDTYFKNYLTQLYKLRMAIMKELEMLQSEENTGRLHKCFELFEKQQETRPRFLRVGHVYEQPEEQIQRLNHYYQRDGQIDKLCGAVHDNALKVLAKLTSYLKELERRNNRLEFINLRLKELAGEPVDFTSGRFVRELLGSAAAPLDMNDADEEQKAEPPAPRSGAGGRRQPPKVFSRTRTMSEEHIETHEEMRLRLLSEFLSARYPSGGELCSAKLAEGEYKQLSLLLKYGLLGEGRMLQKLGLSLRTDSNRTMEVTCAEGVVTGPWTELTGRHKPVSPLVPGVERKTGDE